VNPTARLTDFEKLRAHPFFSGIDFETMHQRPVPFEQEFPAKKLSHGSLTALHDFASIEKGLLEEQSSTLKAR